MSLNIQMRKINFLLKHIHYCFIDETSIKNWVHNRKYALTLFSFYHVNHVYSQKVRRCETFLNCKRLRILKTLREEFARLISIKINTISIMRFIITIIIIMSTIIIYYIIPHNRKQEGAQANVQGGGGMHVNKSQSNTWYNCRVHAISQTVTPFYSK